MILQTEMNENRQERCFRQGDKSPAASRSGNGIETRVKRRNSEQQAFLIPREQTVPCSASASFMSVNIVYDIRGVRFSSLSNETKKKKNCSEWGTPFCSLFD